MTNNKSQVNPILEFIKTLTFSSFVGFGVMMTMVIVFALAINKIKHYEILYVPFSIIMYCIPGFVSTRITIKKYSGSLFFIALAQATVIALILIAISFIWVGSQLNVNTFLSSLIYVFSSSILSVFLPTNTHKKIKRI